MVMQLVPLWRALVLNKRVQRFLFLNPTVFLDHPLPVGPMGSRADGWKAHAMLVMQQHFC
jgi:hypothetical protein